MGKWVRVKDDSGIEKVSLVVRRDTDPEVYEWLQGIPYGKANAYIKAALKAFIEEGRVPVAVPPPAARVTATTPVRPTSPERHITPPPSESATAPITDAPRDQLLQDIDADSLAVMMEMDGRF